MIKSAFDCPRDFRVESFTIEEGYAECEIMSPTARRELRTESDSQLFIQIAQFWGLRHAADIAEGFGWEVDYPSVASRLRRQADEVDALTSTTKAAGR